MIMKPQPRIPLIVPVMKTIQPDIVRAVATGYLTHADNLFQFMTAPGGNQKEN